MGGAASGTRRPAARLVDRSPDERREDSLLPVERDRHPCPVGLGAGERGIDAQPVDLGRPSHFEEPENALPLGLERDDPPVVGGEDLLLAEDLDVARDHAVDHGLGLGVAGRSRRFRLGLGALDPPASCAAVEDQVGEVEPALEEEIVEGWRDPFAEAVDRRHDHVLLVEKRASHRADLWKAGRRGLAGGCPRLLLRRGRRCHRRVARERPGGGGGKRESPGIGGRDRRAGGLLRAKRRQRGEDEAASESVVNVYSHCEDTPSVGLASSEISQIAFGLFGIIRFISL